MPQYYIIHGIMHLLLGNQHARLNLRMCDMWLLCQQEGCVDKIDFPPVEDELRERIQRNNTLEHQKSLWKAT